MNSWGELLDYWIRRYPRQGSQRKGLIRFYYLWMEYLSLKGKMALGAISLLFLVELAPGLQVTAFWMLILALLLLVDFAWPRQWVQPENIQVVSPPLSFAHTHINLIVEFANRGAQGVPFGMILSRLPEPFVPQKTAFYATSAQQHRLVFSLKSRYRRPSQLNKITLLAPGPFGFTHHRKILDIEITFLNFDLESQGPLFPFSQVHSKESDRNQRLVSQSVELEFSHLKEYQEGDLIQHIDHRSWARTGKPIVRVYTPQHPTPSASSLSYIFYFNPFLPHWYQRPKFEKEISRLAQQIQNLLAAGHCIQLDLRARGGIHSYNNHEALVALCQCKPHALSRTDQTKHFIQFFKSEIN